MDTLIILILLAAAAALVLMGTWYSRERTPICDTCSQPVRTPIWEASTVDCCPFHRLQMAQMLLGSRLGAVLHNRPPAPIRWPRCPRCRHYMLNLHVREDVRGSISSQSRLANPVEITRPARPTAYTAAPTNSTDLPGRASADPATQPWPRRPSKT